MDYKKLASRDLTRWDRDRGICPALPLDALGPKFTLGHPPRGQGSEQWLEIPFPNRPRGHCCAPRCSSIPNS
ncbi:hypothetical protein A2U01_0013858 [Trifolium medium]|uniref:Uncharacterized protein n=1 Tax=Trifolium medium TaxID=97028 RepID=A0A392N008_9FABA|nr:hypothetical protein [Trifolium medium]